MPKAQKRGVAADDSEDQITTKHSKKTKLGPKQAGEGGPSEGKDAEGNPFWQLSALRRVGVSKFKGNVLINIREFYDNNGELRPGKKGISLSVDQYKALLQAVPAINAALLKEGAAIDKPNDLLVNSAEEEAPRKVKKKAKANIETTSEEDSD